MKSILLVFLIISSILCQTPNDNCTVEKCVSCPQDPKICTACADEYYLDNNTCQDCAINCKKCSDGTEKG